MSAAIEAHPYGRLTPFFDKSYLWSGYLAGLFMLMIFLITMLQVFCRWIGVEITWATPYASYCMAASTFLAFAHSFNRGVHVRIELLLNRLGQFKREGEVLSFAVAAAVMGWFTYFCWDMVYWSWSLGDVSQELDATPLWLPQLTMAFGITMFTFAIIDHGLRVLFLGDHQLPQGSEA
jgi:TRAP-type C4-dicarboxylate transport system permease small subunit